MNTDIITETFLNRLRTVTAPSHTHLESLPVSASILNPGVTIAEYAYYLSLMHDVIKDTEENIYPLLATTIPDIDDRRKAHLLQDDLAELGITKTNYKKVFTQNKPKLTIGFALGMMYVTEG